MSENSNRVSSKIDKVIGKNLKRIRLARGFSQIELGEKLGLSYQQIQKYEQGTNRISASTLFSLSKILKAPVTDFYSDLNLQSGSDMCAKEHANLVAAYEQITDPKLKKHAVTILKTLASS